MQTNIDSKNVKPRITVAFFAYNQEAYIEQAVTSILKQTYTPYEMIFSDDNSEDKTFELITKITNEYTGSAKIITNKNTTNLGVANHVNKVLNMARGDFIVMAAGDDISFSNRIDVLVNAWLATDRADCSIFTNAIVINEHGERFGLFYEKAEPTINIDQYIINKRCWVGGFSQGFSISLYKNYGPITTETFQEDGALSFRAILNAGIFYLDIPTVYYRRHNSNSYETKKYEKLKALYKSEIGLAKGRLMDLSRHRELEQHKRIKIMEILDHDIKNKSTYLTFPFILRLLIVARNAKMHIKKAWP